MHFNGPDKATRARHTAQQFHWALAAFVPEPAFHITTIFYAQLSGFLCICGAAAPAAYVKNYKAKARVWLERERGRAAQVFALHLTVLFLLLHKSKRNKATDWYNH